MAVSLSAYPSPLVITTKLDWAILGGGGCSEEVFCPLSTAPVGIYLPPKHVLWCIERQSRSMDSSVNAPKELKKKKSIRDVTTSPQPSAYTLKAACLNFSILPFLFSKHWCYHRYLRKELSVVVVVVRVNIILSIFTEVCQRLKIITCVNGDHISSRPHFDSDQHKVDALLMIQLQTYIYVQTYVLKKVNIRANKIQ